MRVMRGGRTPSTRHARRPCPYVHMYMHMHMYMCMPRAYVMAYVARAESGNGALGESWWTGADCDCDTV